MKALLVVGMQVDLLPGGPAEVPDSQELIPVINSLISKFDLVVAANFWMQPTHVCFAANHLWRRPGQLITSEGSSIRLQHIFGVPGSFGAEFIPGLAASKIAFTARMGISDTLPPFSAFFDARRKQDTGLAAFLLGNKVESLYIAGIPLEDEVKNSAQDSIALGFQTYLVKNAVKGRSQEAMDAALSEILDGHVVVIPAHLI
jgi:nicotinamidase/pyrazinamidase